LNDESFIFELVKTAIFKLFVIIPNKHTNGNGKYGSSLEYVGKYGSSLEYVFIVTVELIIVVFKIESTSIRLKY